MFAAVTALMVGLGVSTAFASVSVSPEGPYSSSKATAVTVSGTPMAEAEYVAVSVCNAEASPGTRCDIEGSTEVLETAEAYEEGEIQISVRRGPWQDWNFTSGVPTPVTGSETTCYSESKGGEACAIFVSYYKFEGVEPKYLGAEAKSIVFV